MARRGVRGRNIQRTEKKSSSGGLTVLLFLLLLGSLGFSIYISLENIEIEGTTDALKLRNADLSRQIQTTREIKRPLEKKIKELETQLQVFIDADDNRVTTDDRQTQDENRQSKNSLLLNSLKNDNEKLSAKIVALEELIVG